MASIEARLVAALEDLRRAQGTRAVLLKELEKARTMVSEAQDGFELLSHELSGNGRKEAFRLERLCSIWQTNHNRINLGEAS